MTASSKFTMEHIRNIWYARSFEFVRSLGLLSNSNRHSHISMPLTRYIMSSYVSIPVKHIIIGERPYGTDILPYAASAMSYDPERGCQGTPSTITLGTDISNKHDIEADRVEEWFRDSWKYLACGVFLINVCCYTKFMDNASLYERTCAEEFLRDMIYVSLLVTNEVVHVFPMGNPAIYSAGMVRSSVPTMRDKVRVHSCPNPASLSHKTSDLRSPEITLGKKGVSRSLFNIILSTLSSTKALTEEDYYTMTLGPQGELSSVASKGNALADELAKVEEYFKSGAAVNSNPSGEEVFRRAKEAVSQFTVVINNAKIGLLYATINEPPNVAKGAFKGRDRSYVPKKFEWGTSSNVSSVKSTPPRRATPEVVGFADDDDSEPTGAVPAVSSSAGSSKGRPTVTAPGPPQTPVGKRPPPNAPSSAISGRSVSVGFVDEDTEDELDSVVVENGRTSVSSEDTLTAAELESISYVSDFIERSDEYKFPGSTLEEVNECTRNRRATSDTAKALVKSIRVAASNGHRSAKEALGYEDDITDMANPVVQWVIEQTE